MSGEKQNGREVIDRTTDYLIRHGTDPRKAQEKAREARIRNERKQDEGR